MLLCGLGMWALLVALILLEIAPHVPETRLGWVLLAVAGPPLYLAGELISARLFSREVGTRISPKGFSLARVVVATGAMLLLAGAAWWALAVLHA